MVDAVYAPFLERIAASMPYWPGVKVRGNDRWPAINMWYDAMDSRPSYQAMKSDDFTHTHDLEPQIGPCRSLIIFFPLALPYIHPLLLLNTHSRIMSSPFNLTQHSHPSDIVILYPSETHTRFFN